MAKHVSQVGHITAGRLSGVMFTVTIPPSPDNDTARALVPLLNERGLMPEVGDVYEVRIKLKNAREQMAKAKGRR